MHPWGLGEIVLIFLIILVFWGPKRLGGVGKGLGDGIRNFKDSLRGHDPHDVESKRPGPGPGDVPPPVDHTRH